MFAASSKTARLIVTLFLLLTVLQSGARAHALTCGLGLLETLAKSEQVESSFEAVDRLFNSSDFKDITAMAGEGNFEGEGYCAYRATANPVEGIGEVVKPAYLKRKADKVVLYVSTAYNHFSEFPEVCENRVAQLKLAAERALLGGQMKFARNNDHFSAQAADGSWSIEQTIKVSARGAIVKAQAKNASWRGALNCHFSTR